MKEEKPKIVLLEKTCPQCQNYQLVVRHGRYGEFIACSGFPKCRYIQKESKIIKPCSVCQTGNLVVKSSKGRKSNKKQFLGCTNYPECKHIEVYEPTVLNQE